MISITLEHIECGKTNIHTPLEAVTMTKLHSGTTSPHLYRIGQPGAVGASQEDARPSAVDMIAHQVSHLHGYGLLPHPLGLPQLLVDHRHTEHHPPLAQTFLLILEKNTKYQLMVMAPFQ